MRTILPQLQQLHRNVVESQKRYNDELRTIELTCDHADAAITWAQGIGTLEVSCPDCGQVWTLMLGGYHGSETHGELLERWEHFVDHFIRGKVQWCPK